MEIKLRQEKKQDHQAVFELIKAAFRAVKYSDQTEHLLVERLRQSDAFVPELSIVAELSGELVGHILLTKIQIKNEQRSFPSLALAPVAVKPAFQRKGIGGQLILEAHRIAKELGFSSIVLVGHEQYYPRFGYEQTDKYNIRFAFEAPAANCMIIALQEHALQAVSGEVVYPNEFFG